MTKLWTLVGASVLGLAALPAGADTVLRENLLFGTAGRQSSTAPGGALAVKRTVRMIQTWKKTSPVLGGIATTTIANPHYDLWTLCKAADFLNPGICGGAPARTITTRDGATVQFRTEGEAGFEVKATLDAGSIDPKLRYDIQFRVPDTGELFAGEAWYLAPRAVLTEGALNLRSPTAEVKADLILGVSSSGSATVCTTLSGCASRSVALPSISTSQRELVEIDPNGIQFLEGFLPHGWDVTVPLLNLEADLLVGGLNPPYVGMSFNNGFLPDLPVPLQGPTIDVGNVEVHVPEYETAGSLGVDGVIRASGQDDLLDLRVDLDAMFPGLPVGGVNASLGPLGVSVDAYDIEGGPSVDLFQDLSLTPDDLMVVLDFDREVIVDGLAAIRSFVGDWINLPAFVFAGTTTVTPTFFTTALARSVAGLQFGLELGIDVLKASISSPFLSASFGPLETYDYPFDPDFLKATLFDDSFRIAFGAVRGQSFVISPYVPMLTPVPVPSSAALLAAALGGLALGTRRRAARRSQDGWRAAAPTPRPRT